MTKAEIFGIVTVIGLSSLACSSKNTLLTTRDGAVEHAAGTGGVLGAGGLLGAGGATITGSGGFGKGGSSGTIIPGSGGSGLVGDGGTIKGGSGGKGGTGGGSGGTGTGGSGVTIDGGVTKDASVPSIDSSVDTGKDAGMTIDSALIECESLLGGTCTTMVNRCAVCPAGSYVHPTQAGCSERYQWCCTRTAPSASDCTSGGGVCIANGAECPNKWLKTRTSCGSNPNPVCCAPEPDLCPAFPQKCVDIGGVCTDSRWGICPPRTEIYALSDQLGCENNSYGWCCVDAPPSSCSDGTISAKGMCVPGECTGCFRPVSDPNLTCEAGRSCCVDMCD